MAETKYPEIEAEVIGRDGNAFAVLGGVQKAMRRGGVSEEEIKEFMAEATDGDYNHLLVTCMNWVTLV